AVLDLELLTLRAVEDEPTCTRVEVGERHVDCEAVTLPERDEDLLQLRGGLAIEPRDRARRQMLAHIGDEEVGVEVRPHSETVARRAGAERAVEREEPWAQLRQREAAVRAREAAAEDHLLDDGIAVPQTLDPRDVVAVPERDVQRVG